MEKNNILVCTRNRVLPAGRQAGRPAGRPIQLTGRPIQLTGRPIQLTGRPIQLTGRPIQQIFTRILIESITNVSFKQIFTRI